MKVDTVLKSTLVALTMFTFGALADGRSGSNEVDPGKKSAIVVETDLKTNIGTAYALDLDQETLKRVKDNQLTEAEQKDLVAKAKAQGVRLGTTPAADSRSSAKSTENFWWRPWRWGYGWGGCYGGFYGCYRPYYCGVPYAYYGGYGCGGAGYGFYGYY